jgi:hypothetical protein
MYLRPEPTLTVKDVFTRLDVPTTVTNVASGREAQVHGDGTALLVRVAESDDRLEIPLDDDGWAALGGWLKIPESFAARLPGDVRTSLTNQLLDRQVLPMVVRHNEKGVTSLLKPDQVPFEPRQIVEVAGHVMGEDAPVIELGHDLTAFALDVVSAAGARDLGDPRVGDITRGGLRFTQNLRQNLAPSVQKYMYRLVCTNGMEVQDQGFKLDARGQTVEEVMEELEAMAQRAFAEVERDIEHFYAMREEIVPNPERALNRMAQEYGLPDRTRLDLIAAVSGAADENGENVSMFDLVNVATNMANRENVSRGTRLSLERFGGRTVSSHVERCRSCSSRIV